MYKATSALLAMLLIAACSSHSSVQRSYVSNRDVCQSQAESQITSYAPTTQGGDVKDRNAQLVSLFSDCMFERGWTVATPNREDGKDMASIIEDPQNIQNQTSAAARPAMDRKYPTENQQIMSGNGSYAIPPTPYVPPQQAQPYYGQPSRNTQPLE